MATSAAGRRLSSSRTSSASANQLVRSIYEGWAYHFTPESRKWIRRWLVVDGSRLVVFASDRNCSSQAVVVSLNLGQGTKVKDITLQTNVYGLDIELTTMKGLTENRTDFFGFSTPNECDLWKAYILGFSYGVVPENLNLLPGQLKDVHEAIMDNGLAPPPLPSPHHKRPLLQNVLPPTTMMMQQQQQQHQQHQQQQQQRRPTQNVIFSSTQDDDDHLSSRHSPSSTVISPYSEISTASQPRRQLLDSADVGGMFVEGVEADVLEQLELRRRELAMKALEKEMERMPSNQNHQRGIPPMTVRSFVQMRQQQQQQQPLSWHQSQPSVITNNKDSVRQIASHRVSQTKHRTPLALFNNNELPPFYDDPEKNKVSPSWFISCDREMAEMILTGARSCGNVFMRPSFNINPSETYVISMRRDLPGGLELRHYAVHRTTDGFKLDVVDKHNAMSCLSDVMTFFATYVGPSAQLLNSQDVHRIFGNVTLLSPASITSPRPESSSSLLSLSSSAEKQLIAKSMAADSSVESEVKSVEDNEQRSEKEESHQVLTSSLTSADERFDESIIQPLHVNAKNNAAISNTQEIEAASDHLSSETQHLNDLTSEEKVDASTCC